MQGIGAAGLLLLLVTGQLMIKNVVGFCIAFSNAFGLIAGTQALCSLLTPAAAQGHRAVLLPRLLQSWLGWTGCGSRACSQPCEHPQHICMAHGPCMGPKASFLA